MDNQGSKHLGKKHESQGPKQAFMRKNFEEKEVMQEMEELLTALYKDMSG